MARPDKGQQVLIAARRQRAVQLRAAGQTWQSIADELGYSSAMVAHTDVVRALDAAKKELDVTVEQWRQQQYEHLNRLRRAAEQVLEARHVHVTAGGVVQMRVEGTGTWDDDRQQWIDAEWTDVIDDGPALAAIDRLLKIGEQEARLRGANAPIKTEVTTYDYTVNGVDAQALK